MKKSGERVVERKREKMQIVLMGVRGSIAVSGKEFLEFGGGTSSVLIIPEDDKRHVTVIDAGTGILNISKYLPEETERITILLSHSHIDHIIGLTMAPFMFERKLSVEIMGDPYKDIDIKGQLAMVMKSPLWPVTPEIYSEKINFRDLPRENFSLGDLGVEIMWVEHPDGGSRAFKVTDNKSTFIYANDCELNAYEDKEKLCRKARDCDLLLIDGMYDEIRINQSRGFGHSSWKEAIDFAEKCNAKKTVIVHHYPFSNDEVLLKAESEIKKTNPSIAFGREGEIIII